MVDGDGRVQGLLTLGVIEQLLSAEAAEPADEAAVPAPRGPQMMSAPARGCGTGDPELRRTELQLRSP